MLTALCLAMVFAIALSSYLALCFTSMATSTRSVVYTHCTELAEAGVEQALYALNTPDWSSWSFSNGNSYISMAMTSTNGLVSTSSNPSSLFNYGNGATGVVNITVLNYTPTNPSAFPTIQAQAVITLPNGYSGNGGSVATISKTLTFGGSSNATGTAIAPVFSNAIATTSSTISFGTGGTVDSYNSGTAGSYQNYSAAGASWSAVLMSGNITSTTATVRINNATIHGFVSGYNAQSPTSTNWFSYSMGAKLVGSTTPASTSIDSTRMLTSPVPYQLLPSERIPTGPAIASLGNIGTTMSLPRTVDVTNGLSPPYVYSCTGISLTSATLTITAPVVLEVSTAIGVLINSTGQIVISNVGYPATAVPGLTIINDVGSVFIGGGGILSQAAVPLAKRVALLGTGNTSMFNSVLITTNTPFYGVVYFPYLHVTIGSASNLAGYPQFYGSVIGSALIFGSANPTFHYDLALRSPDTNVEDAAFTCVPSLIAVNNLSSSVP